MPGYVAISTPRAGLRCPFGRFQMGAFQEAGEGLDVSGTRCEHFHKFCRGSFPDAREPSPYAPHLVRLRNCRPVYSRKRCGGDWTRSVAHALGRGWCGLTGHVQRAAALKPHAPAAGALPQRVVPLAPVPRPPGAQRPLPVWKGCVQLILRIKIDSRLTIFAFSIAKLVSGRRARAWPSVNFGPCAIYSAAAAGRLLGFQRVGNAL